MTLPHLSSNLLSLLALAIALLIREQLILTYLFSPIIASNGH